MTKRHRLVANAARALFQHARTVFVRRRARPADLVTTPSEAIVRYKKFIDLASAHALIGFWECDLMNERLAWTDGVYALFELPARSEITRAQALEFYHPESRAQMEALRNRAIAEHRSFSMDARVTTSKGTERWMRLTADVECENGKAVRLLGTKQDITREREMLERLRLLAETDVLTGLANRGQIQERLETCGAPGALLLVDLDGFKQINDTLGHPAGDECLRQVAGRLRRACPPSTLIARLGGDEFAIVIEADMSRREAEHLAESILADLRQPFRHDRDVFTLSGSIGVTLPTGEHDAAVLLTEADLALYAAKAAGRNTARVFSAAMSAQPEARSSSDPQFDLFDDRAADPRETISLIAA